MVPTPGTRSECRRHVAAPRTQEFRRLRPLFDREGAHDHRGHAFVHRIARGFDVAIVVGPQRDEATESVEPDPAGRLSGNLATHVASSG